MSYQPNIKTGDSIRLHYDSTTNEPDIIGVEIGHVIEAIGGAGIALTVLH